jgi:NAD(P)-dependent dehydrogenase (short-subunit alcohol dehydrogenase family)
MSSKLFDLTGKVAMVTGAGKGIGKNIAIGFAQHGADVVLCSRTQMELEKVAQEIEKIGRKALPLYVDMAKISQFDNLVKKTKKAFKHIDILVNNAGALLVAPALEVDEKSWDLVMDTNTKGAFFLCQRVGQVMIQQGNGGSIINVTSEVVQKVEVNIGAYCPSKAALYSITKILAREWGKYKIRVNSLAPCFVNTVLNQPLFAKKKEFYEPKLKGVPLGRHSEPEDLIGAAVFLASDASSYVSGTTILVDGGYTT